MGLFLFFFCSSSPIALCSHSFALQVHNSISIFFVQPLSNPKSKISNEVEVTFVKKWISFQYLCETNAYNREKNNTNKLLCYRKLNVLSRKWNEMKNKPWISSSFFLSSITFHVLLLLLLFSLFIFFIFGEQKNSNCQPAPATRHLFNVWMFDCVWIDQLN